jgi:type IV pilus assembly protein PilV
MKHQRDVPLRNEHGFSLMEVMVSMVVLSFGLISLAGMQVVAIQVNSSANKLTSATTLVQDKIEELMSLPFAHADLSDATPVGACESHDETAPPEGFTLSWCVDSSADGTSKTIDVTSAWHVSEATKSFSLSLVRTIFQP